MFELCDQDDDGCMNPSEILEMLQKVERVFVRESARIEIKSQILLHSMADKKAEQNFNYIMTTIRQQAIKKLYREQLKKQLAEEIKTTGKQITMREMKKKMQAHAPPIDTNSITNDLITYREFMAAVKDEQMFYKILPRSQNFLEVLQSVPEELEFTVSDIQLDDFLMFRYELQLLSKKHLFVDEQPLDVYQLGRNPLSKCQGQAVKDILKDLNKKGDSKNREQEKEEMEIARKCTEIYQTPGIIHVSQTSMKKPSTLASDIKNCIPSDYIYKRRKEENRRDPKLVLAAQNSLKQQPSAIKETTKKAVGITNKVASVVNDTSAPADRQK